MNDELQQRLAEAMRGARRGARSATHSAPLADYAVEVALHRFENAEMVGKSIESPAAWAYRVARNAALRGGAKGSAELVHRGNVAWPESLPPIVRVRLQRWLREHAAALTARQLEIASAIATGQSFHQAARELGRDRTNLRRMFRTVLRRLAARTTGRRKP